MATRAQSTTATRGIVFIGTQSSNACADHASRIGLWSGSLVLELPPAVAVLPFMLYQLAGFGTLHYVVSKPVNWAINLGILGLISGSYIANRQSAFGAEKAFVGVLVVAMAINVLYGVLKLRKMQTP